MVAKTRNLERTRERILRAAQEVFSSHGYAEVGIRDIAALADSNSSLVNRYFGSKEGLYIEALSDLFDFESLKDLDRAQFGKQFVENFLSLDEGCANPLSMLIFSTADSRTREIALQLFKERVYEPMVEWLGFEDGDERTAWFVAITAGFSIYRSLLPLEPFSSKISPAVRERLESLLQSLVDAAPRA